VTFRVSATSLVIEASNYIYKYIEDRYNIVNIVVLYKVLTISFIYLLAILLFIIEFITIVVYNILIIAFANFIYF